jgi:hypothetical protein
MNVFICQTPFQLYYATRIIKFLAASNEGLKLCIIHSNLKCEEIKKGFPNIELLNSTPSGSPFTKIFQLRTIKSRIDYLVRQNDSLRFYMPHVGGFLANYIFFCKKFTEKTELNFFYEGILYFYDYKEPYAAHHLKRSLLGVIVGFTYRYRKVIFPYNSKAINKIYTPLKAKTKGPKNKLIEVLLSKDGRLAKEKNSAYLILGGPIEGLDVFFRKVIDQIINMSNDEVEIFYKGHASFLTHNKEYLDTFANIALERRITYKELDILEPIEQIVDSINVSTIFSYYSSALVNMKLMQPKEYNLICYLNCQTELNPEIENVFSFVDMQMSRF